MYLHHTQYGKTLAFLKSPVKASKTLSIELDPPSCYGCIPCTQVARFTHDTSPVKAYRDAANTGASGEGHPAHTCARANSSDNATCQGAEKNIFNPLTSGIEESSEGKRMTNDNPILSYNSEGRGKILSSIHFVNSNVFGFTIGATSTLPTTLSSKLQRKSVTGSTCFSRPMFFVVHAYVLSYSTASLNALHNCCIVSERMKLNQRRNNNAQNAASIIVADRIRQEPAKSKTGAGWRHTYLLLSRGTFQ